MALKSNIFRNMEKLKFQEYNVLPNNTQNTPVSVFELDREKSIESHELNEYPALPDLRLKS